MICLLFSNQLYYYVFSQTDRPYNYTPLLIKISIDKAIQSYENNSINNAISYLQAAYHQLLMSANSTKNTISNIQTLLLLIEHTNGLISENNTNAETKNDSIMYLNALEEQLGPSVSTSYTSNAMTGTANNTFSKKLFLEYENEPYGLKIQYPYDWIIRINYNYSLPTTSSYTHPQVIGSFYLSNSTEGLPFFYTGVNTNFSKEFGQFPFTLEQYLHKSLQAKKNSSAFPDFNLIEASATNNNTLAGFPAYEIVWTYKHPTYGMRKLVEFGTVVNGNKGYFVDYAASVEKFSKYLPIAQVMKNSFKISMSKRILRS
ncbi:MAG TPA: hypothetical protein VEL11_18460 [Candidatus Bathyarchaeia archaeon]|nr:hypothetical protein [Candidatus Bathyarchaeia archaeon]